MKRAHERHPEAFIDISSQLRLISLDRGDAAEMFRLIEANRPALSRFLSWVDAIRDVASTATFIAARVHSGLRGAQWFKITVCGCLCGMFGIKSVSGDEGIAEVGYWLACDRQGQGIIADIISVMSRYLVAEMGAGILEFRCLEGNQASINVALRSGATLCEILPAYRARNGRSHRLHVYRLRLPETLRG